MHGRVIAIRRFECVVQTVPIFVEFVVDFRHVAKFQKEGNAKATWVENRSQISNFSGPCKIRGEMGKTSESFLRV